MEAALKRGRDIVELDIAFHSLIAEATENRVLLLAREPVTLLFYPALKKLFKHPKTTREISPAAPGRGTSAHRPGFHGPLPPDGQAMDVQTLIDFRRGYDFAGLDIDEVADFHIELFR